MAPAASLLTPYGSCVCGMLWLFFFALLGAFYATITLPGGVYITLDGKGLTLLPHEPVPLT